MNDTTLTKICAKDVKLDMFTLYGIVLFVEHTAERSVIHTHSSVYGPEAYNPDDETTYTKHIFTPDKLVTIMLVKGRGL